MEEPCIVYSVSACWSCWALGMLVVRNVQRKDPGFELETRSNGRSGRADRKLWTHYQVNICAGSVVLSLRARAGHSDSVATKGGASRRKERTMRQYTTVPFNAVVDPSTASCTSM